MPDATRILGNPVGDVPTFDELAADPAKAAVLSPEVAGTLLARLAAVQAALLGRLLTAGADGAAHHHPADDRPLTVPEVAARLQVGKAYVYDLIRRGELTAIRFGKYVRVPPAALREWETRHQEKALDRGQYRLYSSSPRGPQRERRRTPAHPTQARTDAGGTR